MPSRSGERVGALRPLVVFPTYNELRTLPTLVHEVLSADESFDVLVVDDDSPDGTGAWAERAAHEDARIHVLHRASKQGLGSAYKAGFAWGLGRGYDPLFEMDADGSHHPQYLPEMLGLIRGGADLVLGSRFVQGGGIEDWPWDRLLLSRTSNLLTRLALGIKVRDATAGYRAFRAHVLRTIDVPSVRADGYAFQEEMLFRVLKAGFRVIETPIVFTDRLCGTTKISRTEVFRAMGTLARLWWHAHRHPLPEPVRDSRPTVFFGAVPKHLPTPRRLRPAEEARA